MKTATIWYYRLDWKVNKRWQLVDTRLSLVAIRKIKQFYKTSGLWKGEPLRIVKIIEVTTTRITRKIIE